ncbi:(d)CMP kinase [Xylocopilactobacillus apis]|uniref:Cytidylate kinase n=1 Tax=Xylocopilactobacillus apis TaxID=2932183 RepID=A0AAU9CVW2_9LACO|nr:(d)CMP kinase [Xylocopilactobacillus apis]BDR56541.1 cytidylate kinase [Xylocopilactobacillus apis]
MQIAIDGPASTGKSTVAKIIAKKLDFLYVDTGAMYRSLTYFGLKNKIDLNNEELLTNLLKSMNYDSRVINNRLHFFVNSEDVTQEIRNPIVAKNVSQVASYPSVRKHLISLQQNIAGNQNVVMDGRDIGTVVLPSADYKFFLTADPKIRAKRRFLENKKKGINLSLEELVTAIKRRDELDSKQMVMAKDAILIDTGEMSIDQVVNSLMNKIQR